MNCYITNKFNNPIPFYLKIADNDISRTVGLMYQSHLSKRNGMIFIYDYPKQYVGIWMKNTIIPLDVIFIDEYNNIVDIKHGKPFDETVIYSNSCCKYIIEVPFNTCLSEGIEVGCKLIL